MRFAFALMTIFASFTLAGCSTNVKESDMPEQLPEQLILNEYKIGVGDSLNINVWKSPELSSTVPVRPDGKISLPLVGDINAQGLTTEKLSQNIAQKLGEYLRNPQVVVILSGTSADFLLRVRVTGAVNNQVSIPYRQGMTVLDLVLAAGGVSEFASANKAKLYRRINGEIKVYPILLNDILNKGKLQTNYPLMPSDIITVPDRIL